eukprot:6182273-Pleurochrysis_carterae.AAC.2
MDLEKRETKECSPVVAQESERASVRECSRVRERACVRERVRESVRVHLSLSAVSADLSRRNSSLTFESSA